MKIGYEDTDKKIEINIYGIDFEIKNVEKIREYENVEDDDLNSLEKMIETLIGEGSIEKLNNKRKEDGHDEIDSTVALNLLVGICQTYMNSYADNIMRPLEKNIDRIERVNNYNRQTRRYNTRSYRNRGRYDKY